MSVDLPAPLGPTRPSCRRAADENQILDDGFVAEDFAQRRDFGHQFSASLACVHCHGHASHTLAASGAFATQGFQTAHTAFIAGAACFDTLANPNFLLCPELVKTPVGNGFSIKFFVFAGFVGRKIARIAAQDTSVEFENACANRIQESTIVRHNDERTVAAILLRENAFKNFDGFNVKMICRLIKQQKIGLEAER